MKICYFRLQDQADRQLHKSYLRMSTENKSIPTLLRLTHDPIWHQQHLSTSTTYEAVIHALKGSLPNNDNFKQLIKLTKELK